MYRSITCSLEYARVLLTAFCLVVVAEQAFFSVLKCRFVTVSQINKCYTAKSGLGYVEGYFKKYSMRMQNYWAEDAQYLGRLCLNSG